MTHSLRDGSSMVGPMRKLGANARDRGLWPPSDATPATVAGRAFLDGWLGDSWRRRLFGTNFCRVLILPGRLVAVPDRRADLFARSAA